MAGDTVARLGLVDDVPTPIPFVVLTPHRSYRRHTRIMRQVRASRALHDWAPENILSMSSAPDCHGLPLLPRR